MANRYWVGDAGTWSDAANHWATSSGGAAGAGNLPSASDNVFFDANSFSTTHQTVTVNTSALCLNLDISAVTQAYTILGVTTGGELDVAGNLVLNASNYMSISRLAGTVYLVLSGTGSITSNGGSIGNSFVKMDATGTYTFADDLTSVNTNFYLANGTLNTSGRTIALLSFYTASGTKTLTMTSNKLAVSTWNNQYPSGFTFTQGTGTVEIYRSVSYAYSLLGDTTFYNLTITGNNTDELYCAVGGDFTITNNLVFVGYNATNRRLKIRTGTYGTSRTFTAANVSVTNTDFHYITGAGAGSWDVSSASGGAGDCGANSGITFAASKTVYWYSGSGSWSDTTKWFTATAGGGTGGQFPLAHDKAYFDASSFSGGATITMDCYTMPYRFDMSAVDEAVTLTKDAGLSNIYFFGSVYLNSNITCSGLTNKAFFMGLVIEHTLDVDGETFSANYETADKSTELKLAGDYVCTGYGYFRGTIDLQSYTWTATKVNFQQSNGTHELGTGTINVVGTSGEVFGSSASAPINFDHSLIKINPASGSDDIAVNFWTTLIAYNVWFTGSHTGRFLLRQGGSTSSPQYAGSAQYNDFKVDAGKQLYVYDSSTVNAVTFDLNGSSGSLISLRSMTTGNQWYINKLSPLADVNCTYLDVKDCHASPAGLAKANRLLNASIAKFNALIRTSISKINRLYIFGWYATNSTDSGNTDGWIIS